VTGEAGWIARQSLFGRSEHRQQGDDARIHIVFIGVVTEPSALPYTQLNQMLR
jgi:hypothetical protein